MLELNVGILDRTIRILVGSVLVSLVFFGPQTAWGWIGLLPMATGFAGICPGYSLLGMNTCSKKA